MNEQQKQIILEAAQLLQTDDRWWEQFEYFFEVANTWAACSVALNPLKNLRGFTFRRKPRMITVTIPVPDDSIYGRDWSIAMLTVLAAIREAMEEHAQEQGE